MRPSVAAFLSFLWPGLGQAYRGERNRAIGQALPVIAAAVVGAGAILWLGSLVVVAYLFNPIVSLTLIAVTAALGAWRAWSIVDALRASEPLPSRRGHLALAVVLVAATVVSHAWVGWSLFSFYRAGQQIYEPIGVVDPGQPTPQPTDQPTQSPTLEPGQTARPTASPSPTRVPTPLPGANERVTILFIGVDNTHGPDRGLTDTLIVASFDPQTNSLAMISIPRDTGRLQMYSGGVYRNRINGLMQAAARDPDAYPDGPLGTLINEVSYLVGIPVNYYARIDIGGFTRLIDLVGGIDVTLEHEIDDPTYQFSPTEVGFHLLPGTYHLDGKLATAYARSRHGSGNSDYERAARQQQILLALRARVNDPQILLNLPGLLDAVSEIVRTDAPLDRLPDIVAIVQRSHAAGTEHIVLAPPEYADRAFDPSGQPTSMTELDMTALAELSIRLFGDESRYARADAQPVAGP